MNPALIEHRLATLEKAQEHHAERLDQVAADMNRMTLQVASIPGRLDRQDEVANGTHADVREIKNLLVGDGSEKNPGIGSRLTAVESQVQGMKERAGKVAYALWTGGIALVGTFLKLAWDWLKGK